MEIPLTTPTTIPKAALPIFSTTCFLLSNHSQTTPTSSRPHASTTTTTASLNLSIPEKPPTKSKILTVSTPDPSLLFREKALFIESLGLDLISLIGSNNRQLISADINSIKSTVELLQSLGFLASDLRRIIGMCPEILTTSPRSITGVLRFLLREVGVAGRFDLRKAINRRPRLLVSSVEEQLRPTLYFLRSIGVGELHKQTHLLTCTVENKLLPRLEFLEKSGFLKHETELMVRRFPQLFCYSVEENLRPKLEFVLEEMGRELGEVREFPQYFSFSLEKRIRPRHYACLKSGGVVLSLSAMLRPSDEEFGKRLEVCVSSTPPLKWSPLWRAGLDENT